MPGGVIAGDVGQPELLAGGGLPGSGDQGEVVDAGVFDRRGILIGRRLGVGVPADDLRDGGADFPAGPPDGQPGQVERVL